MSVQELSRPVVAVAAAAVDLPRMPTWRVPAALRHGAWFGLAWLLLGGVWELGAAHGVLNPRILPPPSETIPYLLSGNVAVGFGQQTATLQQAALTTIGRVLLGMGLGLAVSLVLAVAVAELRLLRRLVLPIVQSLSPIAPVAWIPFTIVVFGIGGVSAVFIVFMAVVGAMTLSLVAALDAIPAEYLHIARNLRTSRLRLWTRVRLPAIAGPALTTVRMCFFGAWMAVLAGEMAGINSGLGYMIIMAQQLFNMKAVMVGILTIGAIGFAADRLLLLAQHRFTEAVDARHAH